MCTFLILSGTIVLVGLVGLVGLIVKINRLHRAVSEIFNIEQFDGKLDSIGIMTQGILNTVTRLNQEVREVLIDCKPVMNHKYPSLAEVESFNGGVNTILVNKLAELAQAEIKALIKSKNKRKK